jgi:alpha-glucosidase
VRFSRDNARTPLQWDASENAGFSAAKPWLPIHDDYKTCNVEAQEADSASPLSWYRNLAALRAARPELVAGAWTQLMEEDEQIMAFERELDGAKTVTLVNFSMDEATYDASLVEGLALLAGSQGGAEQGVLRPLEATIWG